MLPEKSRIGCKATIKQDLGLSTSDTYTIIGMEPESEYIVKVTPRDGLNLLSVYSFEMCDLFLIPKEYQVKETYYIWLTADSIAEFVNAFDHHCKKCTTFYEYSEPNQADGTLICWACRNRY